MHTRRGFTLIELMVAVAVIGILAAIALPAYNQYRFTARRGDAISQLGQAQLQLERARADAATYPSTLTGIASDYYTIAVSGASATGYTLTATPTGDQASDTCGTLTIVFGNGTATRSPSTANCWAK